MNAEETYLKSHYPIYAEAEEVEEYKTLEEEDPDALYEMARDMEDCYE